MSVELSGQSHQSSRAAAISVNQIGGSRHRAAWGRERVVGLSRPSGISILPWNISLF